MIGQKSRYNVSYLINNLLLINIMLQFKFVRFADWPTLLKLYSGDGTRMQETIEGLFQNNMRLKEKKFGQKTVYTHAFDFEKGAHRLIFERIAHQGQIYFILRSIAFNHEYEKALTWNPLKKEEIAHLAENTTVTKTEQEVDMNDHENQTVRVFHESRWLALNPHQQAILKDKSNHTVVVGPPGSGKTLLSLALLQERALEHDQSDHKASLLRLLYLVPEKNKGLKHSITQEWQTWKKEHLQPTANVKLVIQTIDSFTKWYFEEEQQKKAVDDEHCLTFLLRLTRDKAKSQLFYQEFCLASVLLNNDRENKRRFENSNYQKIGQLQSVLEKKDREELYKLWLLYHFELEKAHQYHPKLSAFNQPDIDSSSNFGVVDEAQLFTTQELRNVLYYVKKCFYFGDSRQNTQYKSLNISPLTVIQAFFLTTSNNTLDVKIQTLEETYRLPPDIAGLAMQVVCLQDNLGGGLPDKYSYSSMTSMASMPPSQTSGIHFTTECDGTYKRFSQDAGMAAIALDEMDLKNAAEHFDTKNAFTSMNAHGLAFPRIGIFVSEGVLQKLRPLSREMIQRKISTHSPLTPCKHRSKEDTPKEIEEGLEILRKFYVAISRSSGDVYIYFQSTSPPHDLKYFIDWFTYRCHGVAEQKPQELHAEISTDEEWVKTINHLILNQHESQARDNLSVHFALAEKEGNLYVAKVLQSPSELPQVYLDFIQTLKINMAVIAPSESISLKPSAFTPALPALTENPAPAPQQREKKAFLPRKAASGNHQQKASTVGVAQQPILPPVTSTTLEKRFAEEIYKNFDELRLRTVLKRLDLKKFLLDKHLLNKKGVAFSLLDYIQQEEGRSDIFIRCIVDDIQLLKNSFIIELSFKKNTSKKFAQKLQALLKLRSSFLASLGEAGDAEVINLVSPVQFLAYFGFKQPLAQFCALGADLDKPTKNGLTPANLAVYKGFAGMLQALHKAGADLDKPDNTGGTPAYTAARKGDVVMLRVLHKAGADLEKPNNSGFTPANVAAEYGHADALRVLHKAGVDLNRPTKDNETPAFIAAQSGHLKAVDFLLSVVSFNTPFIYSQALLCKFCKDKDSSIIERMDAKIKQHLESPGSYENRIPILPVEIAYIMGHGDIVNVIESHEKKQPIPSRLSFLTELQKQKEPQGHMGQTAESKRLNKFEPGIL